MSCLVGEYVNCDCKRRCKRKLSVDIFNNNQNILIKVKEAMRLIEDKNNPLYADFVSIAEKLKGEWFVNSPKHNFCFFAYMQENRDRRHTLQDCANLLNISLSSIAVHEKKALQKLKKYKSLFNID